MTGARMKTAGSGVGPRPRPQCGGVEHRLEGLLLAAVAVAPHRHVERPEALLVGTPVEDRARQQDQPGTGPERRQAVAQPLGQRFEQTRGREQHGEGGRLAARQDHPGQAAQVRRAANRAARRPSSASAPRCSRTSPCRASTPTVTAPGAPAPRAHQPRSASRSLERADLLATHGLAEPGAHLGHVARRRRSGSSPPRWPGPCRAGSSLLKIPEPTNTASAPSCMTSEASAGVAMPPAQNSGTGSSPVRAISSTSPIGAASCLAQPYSSAESAWVTCGCRPGSSAGAGPPPRCCRCRPRPWNGSWPRPRRSAAAPPPGWWPRTRRGR